MKPSLIDWKNGIVCFWDLDEFDPDVPFAEQANVLKEDLVQVAFPNEIVLDIGWYPSFSLEGEFRISVVRNFDWDMPLYEARIRTWSEFSEKLREAIAIAMDR